jgi:hypothetical protein
MAPQVVDELARIGGDDGIDLGVDQFEIARRKRHSVEVVFEHAVAAQDAMVNVKGGGGGVPEMHGPRAPLRADDDPEQLNVGGDQHFDSLNRRHRNLGQNFLAENGRPARLLETHRDRLVEEVLVVQSHLKRIARRSLVSEQQTDDAEVRQMPHFRQPQSEVRAPALRG